MNSSNFGFEELELWKKARDFKKEVRKIAKLFPAEEKISFNRPDYQKLPFYKRSGN
jgi:hypothetical protein